MAMTERARLERVVPTNWLDPLLTGDKAVVQIGKPLTCPDVERLLLAIKQRLDKELPITLRRELAKREARVRRIVKQHAKGRGGTKQAPPETSEEEWYSAESWMHGYFKACDDILAALSGKGARK